MSKTNGDSGEKQNLYQLVVEKKKILGEIRFI